MPGIYVPGKILYVQERGDYLFLCPKAEIRIDTNENIQRSRSKYIILVGTGRVSEKTKPRRYSSYLLLLIFADSASLLLLCVCLLPIVANIAAVFDAYLFPYFHAAQSRLLLYCCCCCSCSWVGYWGDGERCCSVLSVLLLGHNYLRI